KNPYESTPGIRSADLDRCVHGGLSYGRIFVGQLAIHMDHIFRAAVYSEVLEAPRLHLGTRTLDEKSVLRSPVDTLPLRQKREEIRDVIVTGDAQGSTNVLRHSGVCELDTLGSKIQTTHSD